MGDPRRAQNLVYATNLVLEHERYGGGGRPRQDQEPHAVVERVLDDGEALSGGRLSPGPDRRAEETDEKCASEQGAGRRGASTDHLSFTFQGWHSGHRNADRFPNTIFSIRPRHRTQGSPTRPYTMSLGAFFPGSPDASR